MKKLFTLLVVACVLCIPAIASAQSDQKEILTNAQVIAMKNANLSASVIKSKINASPCKFSTDTQSLIELSKTGVDNDIIDLMVTKSASPDAPATPAAATSFTKGLSADKKSYVTATGKTIAVGQTLMLGSGSDKDHNLFNQCHPLLPFINAPVTDTYLPSKYANSEITVKELKNDHDGISYIIFKLGVVKYQIAIEAAIGDNELTVK